MVMMVVGVRGLDGWWWEFGNREDLEEERVYVLGIGWE